MKLPDLWHEFMVSKVLNRSDLKKSLPDELADVLFVLICIANQTGVDLTSALEKNLEKKSTRDGTRHVNNPKLND